MSPGIRVTGTNDFEDQKEIPLFLLSSVTVCEEQGGEGRWRREDV